MLRPRDIVSGFPVPVDFSTGKQLTEHQVHHLEAINEAVEKLRAAMHAAEGSSEPGEHQDHQWGGRRMSIAGTYLEIAVMFAHKAALE